MEKDKKSPKTIPRKTISHDDIVAIIDMMADGVDLKQASEIAGIAYSTVRKYRDASVELTALYARARADYARCRVEEIHVIAKNEPDVQRARLMIDCIKWDVSKVLPKEFGDKLTLSGDGESPLKVAHTFDAGSLSTSALVEIMAAMDAAKSS